MKTPHTEFDEHHVIHELKHYLPAQAPLKDFIHHNTLHAFQTLKFHDALRHASKMFGYKTFLTLNEFRELYHSKKIREEILDKKITEITGSSSTKEWKEKLISKNYDTSNDARIGRLRSNWKKIYRVDLDVAVQPALFRILCSYLDQGISIWNFPVHEMGFLTSLSEMERNSYTSIFKTKRAKDLLLNSECKIEDLLQMIVGDKSLFQQYLFDQQFSHQGWSGMVSVIEDQPETLVDPKKISLKEVIVLELLLEIDELDSKFGPIWAPLATRIESRPTDLFNEIPETELNLVFKIWQEAYEWSYYDEVLAGIKLAPNTKTEIPNKSFQVTFCIDDRETSLRDYLEKNDPNCETYATPGFFGVEFYFQPEFGKSYTKQCPAPVTPKFLIKEVGVTGGRKKDAHFAKHTHGLFRGWIIAQTLGFWSAFRLFLNIFKPTMTPATASSFSHMDKLSQLTIEHKESDPDENGLQVGYTINEMADRVEALLKSIGLVKDFAPLVYSIGHGSSSVNNPHYAAYNCGACCGRPGSVNARVISFMANHPQVREILKSRGITIPAETRFVGGLHDTTRDEIVFYDENLLSHENKARHEKNIEIFKKALDLNSKERSRRFESINTKLSPDKIHKKILTRSVSLFEPRPELNHATNTMCIVGRREITKKLFLDRRAFTNSYDYRIDPDGKILINIMKPLGPVCGGINLEYFFSRVDNQKLGAGTKLPHNVMGLFGVANGADGD
ncbi:MAG: YbcC family protein, partial [Bacteroidia bacterium]